MGIVKKGDKISVFYTGKLEDGTIFDSNIDSNSTLDFKVGAEEMIEGFDNGVIGMELGEKKEIKIKPKEGYGLHDSSLTQTLRKKDLVSFKAAGYTFEVGDFLPYGSKEVVITKSDEENIVIDTNHELAGKTLIFEIEIVKIK